MRLCLVWLSVFLAFSWSSFGQTPEEVEIGQKFDEVFCREHAILSGRTAMEVETIGKALAAASDKPGMVFTFRVYSDQIDDAFALPGGFIYLSTGFLQTCNNPSEKAAVIAHEMAHCIQSHGIKEQKKAKKLRKITKILDGVTNDWASAIVGVGMLHRSRKDEVDADERIIPYMEKGGFDLLGAVAIFGYMKGEATGSGPTFLETHPKTSKRYKSLYAQVVAARLAKEETALEADPTVMAGKDKNSLLFGMVIRANEKGRVFTSNIAWSGKREKTIQSCLVLRQGKIIGKGTLMQDNTLYATRKPYFDLQMGDILWVTD